MLREWIVTLYDRNQLDDFYDDMQTPGGALYIPDRAVDVSAQRPTSRNTHYMLTYEEAMLVKNDERVWGVELYDIVVNSLRPLGYKIDEGVFSKNVFTSGPALSQVDVNWGLLRQNRNTPPANWGFDNFLPQDPNNANAAESELLAADNNVIVTASGRNVDVLIVDEHLDQTHPEFAANRDGSGGTRCVAYNWFQNDVGFGTGTYQYGLANQSNHGTHVGGIAAGNNQGWARDANVYSLGAFPSTANWGVCGYDDTTMWDYVRAWHNSKPINPVTGRKNPTVSNHSYGAFLSVGQGNFSQIYAATYRGVRYAPGRALTVAELQARGFKTSSQSFGFQNYSISQQADLQDAMADGIIVCTAAGNEGWKQVQEGHVDYNNEFEVTYLPTGQTYKNYYQRGGGGRSGQAYAPVLVVGSVGTWKEEYKSDFSNCGNGVDVFAVGSTVQSSVHAGGYFGTIQDPRSGGAHYLAKTQGTSMATPQVAGMLACLAETWPNMTQAQAHQWIIDFSTKDALSDTGTDDAMDEQSLQGAPNRFAKWINQRPIGRTMFPPRNFRPRTLNGDPIPSNWSANALLAGDDPPPATVGRRVYPRPRIRRRG